MSYKNKLNSIFESVPSLKELLYQRQAAIATLQEFEIRISKEDALAQGHPELEGQVPWNSESGADRARNQLYKINGLIRDLYPDYKF